VTQNFTIFTLDNTGVIKFDYPNIQTEKLIQTTLDDESLDVCYYLSSLAPFIKNSDLQVNWHANVFILDKNRNTIERFDPHGITSLRLDKQTIQTIEKKFTYKKGDKQITPKFIDTGFICPYNIQGQFDTITLQNNDGTEKIGLCQPWTWYYIFIRILYPQLTQIDLINNFLKGQDSVEKFKNFVLFILEVNEKQKVLGDNFKKFVKEKFAYLNYIPNQFNPVKKIIIQTQLMEAKLL
jgi:hypothetical protein